jgi:chorismate-pyruvate lyase
MSIQRHPTASSTAAPFAPRAVFTESYPLDEFYAARRMQLPVIGQVDKKEIPEPYRSLLVHRSDMTSKLEAFHKGKIHIEPIARNHFENEYFREVVLVLDGSLKRVEFGAIKIILDLFPNEAQEEILKEQRPLGQILKEYNVQFASRPRAFLRVASDDFIQAALGLTHAASLYGRRNTLIDAWDRPLAEIVEILPP